MDRRIATGLAAPELKGGIDWTVGRKLLGGFKKEGRNTKASALRCVWQGALVCSQNSAVKVCPRCHQEADWEHVLLDCAWWEAQNWELPVWFQEGRAQGPRSLWTRASRLNPTGRYHLPRKTSPPSWAYGPAKRVSVTRSLSTAQMLVGALSRRTRDSGR